MCPSRECRADNPVQVLIDGSDAERIGHPELAGAIQCTECGTVWLRGDDAKTIVGRFAEPLTGRGWIARGTEAAPGPRSREK